MSRIIVRSTENCIISFKIPVSVSLHDKSLLSTVAKKKLYANLNLIAESI